MLGFGIHLGVQVLTGKIHSFSLRLRFFCSFNGKTGSFKDCFDYSRLLQIHNSIETLKILHAGIITSGYQQNPFLAAKLVSRYSETANMNGACQVLNYVIHRDVLLWNVVIRGYANSGPFEEALAVYQQMVQSGVCANHYTFPFLLKACGAMADLRKGQKIHGHILRFGLGQDSFIGNALVTFYAKCQELNLARKLFDDMSVRDLITWNSMIVAYSQNNCASKAIDLLHQMFKDNPMNIPDRITLVGILPACTQLASIKIGTWIHSFIIRSGMEVDAVLGSGLVGMYAACGHLETARYLFNKISDKNIIVWNAIIRGYGMHGYAEEASKLFTAMVEAGIHPDNVSFVNILSACSHAGLINQAFNFFNQMESYGVEKNEVHYACMVDLLGRAGRLEEAIEFIKSMPIDSEGGVWGALLGACRIHNNIELAEEAAKKIFVLDPDNAGRYVLMARMYEDAGRLEDAAKMRKMMNERRVRKPLGCSAVEVDLAFHTFGVEDDAHPQIDTIYEMLQCIEKAKAETDTVHGLWI